MKIDLYKCNKCGESNQQHLFLKYNPLYVICLWCKDGIKKPNLNLKPETKIEIKEDVIKDDEREHEDDYWAYPFGENSGFYD